MSTLRRTWSIASTLLVIAVVTLAVLLVGVRLVGLTPLAVLSGSMEPTYPVGSLIYVAKTDAENIPVGTAITFRMSGSALATHRVVEILYTESGDNAVEAYITKGDANSSPDGNPVKPKDVVGAPVFHIPYLGYFSDWLQSGAGWIAGVALAAALLLSALLSELWPKADKPPAPETAVREAATPAEAPEGTHVRRRRAAKYENNDNKN